MEKMLAQAQIDALFATVEAKALQTSSSASEADLEIYNFSRAGQISHEQMQAISTVNDLFARNLMDTLGAWLRTEFRVALVSGEQMPFAEFVGRVPEKTYVCSMRLEPLGAMGLLEFELSLALPVFDLLLGGTGRAAPVRVLTEIEELIMTSVVQMVIKELNAAWQQVGLQFSFDKREAAAQVAKLMPTGEKTLCVSFEINMPEAQGMLNLCLPAVVLNAILRRMHAERDRPRRRAPETALRVKDLVGQTTVGAVLQFPPVRLRAREISALKIGTVLRLPLPQHTAAELKVGGLSFWKARPVRVGEHRGGALDLGDSRPTYETQDQALVS